MTAPLPAALTDDERALCAVSARWLAACGRSAGALGLGAAGMACLVLLARPGPAWAAWTVLALLPFERLLALRLRLDAGLFADLAAGCTRLATLDAALATLQLRPAAARTRSLTQRVAGARRLAWQHVALALLQAAALLAALAAGPVKP